MLAEHLPVRFSCSIKNGNSYLFCRLHHYLQQCCFYYYYNCTNLSPHETAKIPARLAATGAEHLPDNHICLILTRTRDKKDFTRKADQEGKNLDLEGRRSLDLTYERSKNVEP